MNLKKLTPFVAKTFADLVFEPHANDPTGIQARLDLGNGLEFSVISGNGCYGSVDAGTYEVAVYHNDEPLPLSPFDSVLGWRTEDELTELMGELQGKPEDIHAFIEQMHEHKEETRADLELD